MLIIFCPLKFDTLSMQDKYLILQKYILGDKTIHSFLFVDDQVILAEDAEDAWCM